MCKKKSWHKIMKQHKNVNMNVQQTYDDFLTDLFGP